MKDSSATARQRVPTDSSRFKVSKRGSVHLALLGGALFVASCGSDAADPSSASGGATGDSDSGGEAFAPAGGRNDGGGGDAFPSGGTGGTGASTGGVPSVGGRNAAGGVSNVGGSDFVSGGSGGMNASGGSASGGASMVAPQAQKDAESLALLSGLQIVSYGGYLNGESFQQDALVTHNGYQYASFWNTNRNVVLARRELPAGEWEKFDFTDYTNTEDDAHNTISLGICPEDGTLHLAFDHHGSPLHYRRSVVGLTTAPQEVPWNASSFSAVTNSLSGASPINLVTYPRFVSVPGGERLLLAARIGSSGSGDEHLWEYDSDAESWTERGRFIDGITDSVNAYLHGLAYTRGGTRLHMTWCWRETPDPQTNHDLFYSYSDDNGLTWLNNSGETIATTGSSFISRDSSGALVSSISQNRGLINQEHMAVDAEGRVHVLLSHMPDAEADDANFTRSRTRSLFFHYFRDTDGTWSRRELNESVDQNFRGSLGISSSGNVYAVLPGLRVLGASPSFAYNDWSLLVPGEAGRFFSDPLVDTTRLALEDKLTVYYPQASSPNVWTVDFSIW